MDASVSQAEASQATNTSLNASEAPSPVDSPYLPTPPQVNPHVIGQQPSSQQPAEFQELSATMPDSEEVADAANPSGSQESSGYGSEQDQVY